VSSVDAYLLDTNVISETRRKQPEKRVLDFLEAADPERLFLSVLTFGELRRGIVLKQQTNPVDAMGYGTWSDELETLYADRVLPVNAAIAKVWGRLSADRSRPVADTLLAATAIVHDLTLVTRNTRDMRGLSVKLINPWVV
jgi:toxin FitB